MSLFGLRTCGRLAQVWDLPPSLTLEVAPMRHVVPSAEPSILSWFYLIMSSFYTWDTWKPCAYLRIVRWALPLELHHLDAWRISLSLETWPCCIQSEMSTYYPWMLGPKINGEDTPVIPDYGKKIKNKARNFTITPDFQIFLHEWENCKQFQARCDPILQGTN